MQYLKRFGLWAMARHHLGALILIGAFAALSACQTAGPPPARSESAILSLLGRFETADAAELLQRSHRPFVLDREILRLTPDIELFWEGLVDAELGFSEARIRSIQPVYDDSYRDFADTAAMRRHFRSEVVAEDSSIVEIETPAGDRYALLLGGRTRGEPALLGLRGPLAQLASVRAGRVSPTAAGEDGALEPAEDDEIRPRVIASGADDHRTLDFPGGRLRFGAHSVAAVSEYQSNERRIMKVTPSLGEFRLEIDPLQPPAGGGDAPREQEATQSDEAEAAGSSDSADADHLRITAVELERFGSTVTVVVDRREHPVGRADPSSELVVLAASDGATIFASVRGEFAIQTGGRRANIGPREALEVLPGGRPGDRLRWIGDTIGYGAYERDRRDRFLRNPVAGLLQLQRVMSTYRSDVAGGGRRAPGSALAAEAMRVYMLPRLYVAMKVHHFGAFEEPQYLSFAEVYRAITDEYEVGIVPRL